MANRQIADKLASGEITSIKIGGTGAGKEVALTEDLPLIEVLSKVVSVLGLDITDKLRWAVAPDNRKNALLRVGIDGQIGLYQAQNTTVLWTDTDATDVSILDTEGSLLTATPDHYIPVGRGSFLFYGNIENTESTDRTVTLKIYVNAVEKMSKDFTIPANTTKVISWGDLLLDEVTSGHNIELRHEANATGCVFKGTVRTSTLEINRAKNNVAPIFVSGSLLTPAPTKAEIIALVGDDVDEESHFFIRDSGGNTWHCYYDGTEYYHTTMTLAT